MASLETLPAWLIAALRTAVQVAWSAIAAWLVQLGVPVPDNAIAQGVLFALLAGAVVAALRWLETREGDRAWAKLARRVAAFIMVGLSRLQPIYAAPADSVRINGDWVQTGSERK